LIEDKITKNTKAIIPVHLFGQCADMDRIMEIARINNLKVIEDTAQAMGATYKGKQAGSMGDMGALSFFPSKNLGGFGDGGMIITNNKELADKVRMLRVHGSTVRYIHSAIGMNSRLDAFQAAILRVKLKHLDKWLEARRKVAKYYDENLKGLPLVTPYSPSYNTHTYHLYVLRVKPSPEKLAKALNGAGIEARTYYPVSLHMQECYKNLGYKKNDIPESEFASPETLAIPIYPEPGPTETKYIIDSIKSHVAK
jgi:dTDP-4-amino-4,6-dideoxygalactose transaminase